eukprot:m.59046 g.59046  ORF g.59046 m.59046 type:complete len:368 (-) comp11217_c0_seq1:129-1232(-)
MIMERALLLMMMVLTAAATKKELVTATNKLPYNMVIGTANYAGTPTRSVHVVNLNSKEQLIEEPPAVQVGPNPSWLCSNKAKTVIIAALETTNNEVGGLASMVVINGRPQGVNFVPWPSGETYGPTHCEQDPTGNFVVAANYAQGSAAVFPIMKTGELRDATQHVEFGSQSNAHCVAFSPDGEFVYIVDLGLDIVHAFKWDDGKMTELPKASFKLPAKAGPRHMVFNDGFAFLVTETSNQLLVLQPQKDGSFKKLDEVSTLPPGFKGIAFVAEVKVGGNKVFVSNRGENSIAIFSYDKAGSLKALQWEKRHINTPRGMGLSPDAQYLIAASQTQDTLVAFHVSENGTTTLAGDPIKITRAPVCVEFL